MNDVDYLHRPREIAEGVEVSLTMMRAETPSARILHGTAMRLSRPMEVIDPQPDPAAILQTLDLMCPDAPVELRAKSAAEKMEVARFTAHRDAAGWAARRPDAGAVYVVMNPYDPAHVKRGEAVKDADITRRRWLLIDADPEREAKTNATISERRRAGEVIERVTSYLTECQWPEPVEADSGNGGHALYRIDLPNDEESDRIVENILQYLDRTFSTDAAKIDTKVGNASRITKLYGTVARKGPASLERPHRLSRITRIPEKLRAVALPDLQKVANLGRPRPTKTERTAADHKPQPLPKEVNSGSRNSSLFREGCRLVRLGWSEPEVFAALKTVNATRNNPPLDENEVATIARSCARYDAAEDLFPITEAGDAEFFAAMFADAVRYDHRRGLWLILDPQSGIWLPDRDGGIYRLAVQAMHERQRIAANIEDHDLKKATAQWAFKGESRSRLENMLALARNVPPVADAGDGWDQIPDLLGTPTGVVELRTGTLRKARPEERITMRTAVAYDPAAKSDLWMKTLADVFPVAEERTYLQTSLGYTITGEMNLDKWFLPHGPQGRNGKGTVFGAVRTALADYAIELDAATFDRRKDGTPFNLAKLPGKRFAHCAEAGDSTTLHHDRLKQISGGDPIMAGDKNQRAFEFPPKCKVWFSCNNRPKVSDESASFWARVVVILFAQTFHGREDTTIRDALRRDLQHQQAVLRWLVEGAMRYYNQNSLGEMPAAFKKATAEFQLENDRLAEFYDDRCVVDSKAKAKASDLFKAYQTWTQDAGVRYPLGSKSFYQQVSSRFEKKTKADGNWYVGIGLKAENVQQPLPDVDERVPF